MLKITVALTGRRISCKKRERRKTFELRSQLNSRVGRRCVPDNRRMFRRPVEPALPQRQCQVEAGVRLFFRITRHFTISFFPFSLNSQLIPS